MNKQTAKKINAAIKSGSGSSKKPILATPGKIKKAIEDFLKAYRAPEISEQDYRNGLVLLNEIARIDPAFRKAMPVLIKAMRNSGGALLRRRKK